MNGGPTAPPAGHGPLHGALHGPLRGPLAIRLAYAAPGLAVVLLFALYRTAYALAQVDRTVLEVPEEAWVELPGNLVTGVGVLLSRTSWGVAWMLFLVIWGVALVGGVHLLSRALRDRPPAVRARARIAAYTVAVVGFLLSVRDPLTVPSALPILDRSFLDLEMYTGQVWLRVSTALAVAAALLLTAATTATLAPPARRDVGSAATGDTGEAGAVAEGAAAETREAGEGGVDPVEHLRRQVDLLRKVLYLGAAVLVAGTLLSGAFHHLPLPLLEGDARAAVERLAQGLSVTTGTLWTLVLLAMYLPAALLLSARARSLAEAEAGEAPAREQWLEERGLSASWVGHLARLAALLAPFLTSGPAAALFDFLSLAG